MNYDTPTSDKPSTTTLIKSYPVTDLGDAGDINHFVPIIIIITTISITISEMFEKKLIIFHADAIITRYTL